MGAFVQSNASPFNTQLPGDTQSFLGNPLSQSDPLTSMMMAGSSQDLFWNFNQGFNMSMTPTPGGKLQEQQSGPQHAPSFAGLNATLAPASSMGEEPMDKKRMLDDQPVKTDSLSSLTKEENVDEVKFGDDAFGMDGASNQDLFFENALMGKDGTTPGLNGDSWDSWIHDGSWADAPTASQ
jgi:hypothetical protein